MYIYLFFLFSVSAASDECSSDPDTHSFTFHSPQSGAGFHLEHRAGTGGQRLQHHHHNDADVYLNINTESRICPAASIRSITPSNLLLPEKHWRTPAGRKRMSGGGALLELLVQIPEKKSEGAGQ